MTTPEQELDTPAVKVEDPDQAPRLEKSFDAMEAGMSDPELLEVLANEIEVAHALPKKTESQLATEASQGVERIQADPTAEPEEIAEVQQAAGEQAAQAEEAGGEFRDEVEGLSIEESSGAEGALEPVVPVVPEAEIKAHAEKEKPEDFLKREALEKFKATGVEADKLKSEQAKKQEVPEEKPQETESEMKARLDKINDEKVREFEYGTRTSGYDTIRGIVPKFFHEGIDKMEAQSADSKAAELSVFVAGVKGKFDSWSEKSGRLAKNLTEIDSKLEQLKSDPRTSFSAEERTKIQKDLEGQRATVIAEAGTAKERTAFYEKQYNENRIQLKSYEEKRDNIADALSAKVTERMAPHLEARVDLENKRDNLNAQMMDYQKQINGYNTQMAALGGGSYRTRRALEREINKATKLLESRAKELDKVGAKLVPIVGKISRWESEKTQYDDLKQDRAARHEKTITGKESTPVSPSSGAVEQNQGQRASQKGEAAPEPQSPEEIGPVLAAEAAASQEQKKSPEQVIQSLNEFIDQWNGVNILDKSIPKIEFSTKKERNDIVEKIIKNITKGKDQDPNNKIDIKKVTPAGFNVFLREYIKEKKIHLDDKMNKELQTRINEFQEKLTKQSQKNTENNT